MGKVMTFRESEWAGSGSGGVAFVAPGAFRGEREELEQELEGRT
jgi:hypothetical protein